MMAKGIKKNCSCRFEDLISGSSKEFRRRWKSEHIDDGQ
jgi:hypothetical protein